MLSGDSPQVAAAIGADLGLATSRGAMSPTDKAAHLAALKTSGHHIAMVGDGINDAPALAHADLGIALASGTDIAAATADVTLMRGDLRLVGAVLELAGRVRRTIVENLFWAFLFNVIGMPLAAFGYLSPEFAGAAMAISSVMVIGNALRLGRWTRRRYRRYRRRTSGHGLMWMTDRRLGRWRAGGAGQGAPGEGVGVAVVILDLFGARQFKIFDMQLAAERLIGDISQLGLFDHRRLGGKAHPQC